MVYLRPVSSDLFLIFGMTPNLRLLNISTLHSSSLAPGFIQLR